jgi:hypothetical protein
MKIDFAIQTSERTRNRLELMENWTRHVQAPSTVRIIGDEIITGIGDYESAIEKTIHAIDTFDAEYEWLYIMDDDGYVVPSRLEERLRDCNPDEHHAIGCVHGKLSTATHKFLALHGGCGMALSRATVCALQQRLWAEEFYRHERHSDATISYNLHYLGVVPTGDERFTQDADTRNGWISCHQPKESDYPRLNEAQQEGNQIKGILKGVSQNAVKGFV